MQTILIGSRLASGSQSLLFADVLARYYRQSGHEVFYLVLAESTSQLDQAKAKLAELKLEPDWLAAADTAKIKATLDDFLLTLQTQGLIYRDAKSGQDLFRLTDFSASLHELLDWSGSGFDQATRQAAADYLQSDLKDLVVLEKDSQTTERWFSQLSAYLAASLAWADITKGNWQKFWTLPAQTVYVGSPAERLELALFWPALLSGLNPALKLPDQIMTKTRGRELTDLEADYPLDSKRYYLLRTSCPDLPAAHKKDLAGSLSSFVTKVYDFLIKHHFGCTPNEPCDPQIETIISKTYAAAGNCLVQGEFDQALDKIFFLLDQLETYFKAEDLAFLLQHDPDRCDQALASCLTGLVNLAQLLAPFLPEFAANIWQELSLSGQCSWSFVNCPGGKLLKKTKDPFRITTVQTTR